MKTKDPRKIKSYPCSPRSQNIASQKWNHRADEANVSWEDEDQQTQVLRSYRKIGTLSRKYTFLKSVILRLTLKYLSFLYSKEICKTHKTAIRTEVDEWRSVTE